MKQFTTKFLAVLLSLVLAFSAGLTAFAACNGDLTGDNKVRTEDARSILRAAIGLDTLSAAAKKAADMDLDGAVTTADARLALRVAVGLEASDGKLYENQYDVLRSGFFYTDFNLTDVAETQDMVVAVTDKSAYMQMEFSDPEMQKEFGIDAIQIHMLFLNDKTYLLDPENRQYGEFPFEEMGMSADELGSMSDAKNMFKAFPALSEATSVGSGTFGGVSCTVYTFDSSVNYPFSEKNGSLKVYLNGPKLLGIEEYAGPSPVITYTFRAVALTVPTTHTAIPAGYTEGDAVEILFAIFFGDLLDELDL